MRDLTFLPEAVVSAARLTHIPGEIEWPLVLAPDAIRALAAEGRVILALDMRSYDGGSFTSPVHSYEAEPGTPRRGMVITARDHALAVLRQPNISSLGAWVVITWDGEG